VCLYLAGDQPFVAGDDGPRRQRRHSGGGGQGQVDVAFCVATPEAEGDQVEAEEEPQTLLVQDVVVVQVAQGKPPPLPVAVPDDPRVRGLNVRPHTLNSYDVLSKEHDHDQETDG